MESRDARAEFHSQLAPWAAALRRRLLAREVVRALAVSSVLGAACIAVGWWTRAGLGWQLGTGLGLPLLGAAAGMLQSRRRRWTTEQVALFLDARLATGEAISAALTAEASDTTDLSEAIWKRAGSALAGAPRERLELPLVRRRHWALLGTLVAAAPLLFLQPPAGQPPGAPSDASSESAQLPGLANVEALTAIPGRDPEQTARLQRLAAEARTLRQAFEAGLERRAALARIAELQDRVRAERLRFHDVAERPGREAAALALRRNAALERAAAALGDGDLTAFDAAMQQLARELEREDREQARQQLEEAARAAAKAGAPEAAALLRESGAALTDGGLDANLQELASALGEAVDETIRRQLARLAQTTSATDRAKLAEALAKALSELDAAERRALAEQLRARLADAEHLTPMGKDQLHALAETLSNDPAALRRLTDAMKQLAAGPSAARQRRESALAEAEGGLDAAQRALGGLPLPVAAGQEGEAQSAAPGGANRHGDATSSGTGDDGPSPARSSGHAKEEHDAATRPDTSLRAKASPRLLPGTPLRGASLGRAPAAPGEVASLPAPEAALDVARPAALRGVERQEVPEEYREHVSRYFTP